MAPLFATLRARQNRYCRTIQSFTQAAVSHHDRTLETSNLKYGHWASCPSKRYTALGIPNTPPKARIAIAGAHDTTSTSTQPTNPVTCAAALDRSLQAVDANA